jgi:hypothetical protein
MNNDVDWQLDDALNCDSVGVDPIHELGNYTSDAAFAKHHRATLAKLTTDLGGYVNALRKLPSNTARRELLAGYDRALQPALREILLEEGLL